MANQYVDQTKQHLLRLRIRLELHTAMFQWQQLLLAEVIYLCVCIKTMCSLHNFVTYISYHLFIVSSKYQLHQKCPFLPSEVTNGLVYSNHISFTYWRRQETHALTTTSRSCCCDRQMYILNCRTDRLNRILVRTGSRSDSRSGLLQKQQQ